MLKIISELPDQESFVRIQDKGDRYQWKYCDCDLLRVLSPFPDPWGIRMPILILLETGKTRQQKAGKGVQDSYPKKLNLLCLPDDSSAIDSPMADIILERYRGNFSHSTDETLLFFSFLISQNDWLMLSIENPRHQ